MIPNFLNPAYPLFLYLKAVSELEFKRHVVSLFR